MGKSKVLPGVGIEYPLPAPWIFEWLANALTTAPYSIQLIYFVFFYMQKYIQRASEFYYPFIAPEEFELVRKAARVERSGGVECESAGPFL